jgi:hypothetical protein
MWMIYMDWLLCLDILHHTRPLLPAVKHIPLMLLPLHTTCMGAAKLQGAAD